MIQNPAVLFSTNFRHGTVTQKKPLRQWRCTSTSDLQISLHCRWQKAKKQTKKQHLYFPSSPRTLRPAPAITHMEHLEKLSFHFTRSVESVSRKPHRESESSGRARSSIFLALNKLQETLWWLTWPWWLSRSREWSSATGGVVQRFPSVYSGVQRG